MDQFLSNVTEAWDKKRVYEDYTYKSHIPQISVYPTNYEYFLIVKLKLLLTEFVEYERNKYSNNIKKDYKVRSHIFKVFAQPFSEHKAE